MSTQSAHRDLGGGRSISGVLGQHLEQNVLERPTKLRAVQTRKYRSGVDVLVENRRRMFRLERRLTGDQLVQHATERVHIRRLAGLRAPRPLRRNVKRAADELTGRRQRARPLTGQVSDTEVRDLDGPIRRQQQVARFHITMYDVLPVRRGESGGGLLDDVDRAIFRQRSVQGDFLGDSPAFDQFHHQEEALTVVTEVVHRDDMRITQPGGGSRLAMESLGRSRIPVGRQQQLDRDRPPELFIGGAEHLSHPAAPNRGTQPVSLRNQHPDTRTQCHRGPTRLPKSHRA